MGGTKEAKTKWRLANPDWAKEHYQRNREDLIRKAMIHQAVRIAKYPELKVWQGMRQRCLNPNSKAYKFYGARGITVAPQWKSFKQFRADVGPRPTTAHQLHRLGDRGNYEPGNVVWSVDHSEGF